jgi:hypothetical protein
MTDEQPKPRAVMPWAVLTAALSILLGAGLYVAGIYLLAGLGWALVNGAALCFALAAVIVRGLRRG